MGRAAILGNGRLTVGLNEKGHVHDFYYPYVGLDNLTTARSIHHKIGVWVDGTFSWTDSPDWTCTVELSSDALVASVTMRNESLGVQLSSQDFVDYAYDAFCRMMRVENISDSDKEVRIFMHQVFEISRAGRADTALYEPDNHYILDYKGRCCLLIAGEDQASSSFDQYAVGNYGIEGKQGTFKDAEDGELSGHPVEHGGVDSVIRFSYKLLAGESSVLDYWIVAQDSQYACEKIHSELKQGLAARLSANQIYWQEWLSVSDKRLVEASEEQREFARKSLMVIKAHIDTRGGIIASCDSSIYNNGRDYYSYVWPRDGAYALWPLIRLGYCDEAKAFFKFCVDILHPEGYLLHKYQPDRAIGSTWHPLVHGKRSELAIQEDETATVLIMIGEYLDYSSDDTFVRYLYEPFVVKVANFMTNFVDDITSLPHASYDLWEEKFLTSTYTTATVYRALHVASDLAEKFGTPDQAQKWRSVAAKMLDQYALFIDPDRPGYRKGYLLSEEGTLNFDNTVDASSFYGIMTFGYYPKGKAGDIKVAVNRIEQDLGQNIQSGGTPRYENDNYFRVSQDVAGNPWIITSLWVAQFYIRMGDKEKASNIIKWAQSQALMSGVLPEQINPINNSPVSVMPLVWSHAEYINTILDFTHHK